MGRKSVRSQEDFARLETGSYLLHDGTLARDVKAIASSLEHDKAHGARENERQAGDHVQDAVLHRAPVKREEVELGRSP